LELKIFKFINISTLGVLFSILALASVISGLPNISVPEYTYQIAFISIFFIFQYISKSKIFSGIRAIHIFVFFILALCYLIDFFVHETLFSLLAIFLFALKFIFYSKINFIFSLKQLNNALILSMLVYSVAIYFLAPDDGFSAFKYYQSAATALSCVSLLLFFTGNSYERLVSIFFLGIVLLIFESRGAVISALIALFISSFYSNHRDRTSSVTAIFIFSAFFGIYYLFTTFSFDKEVTSQGFDSLVNSLENRFQLSLFFLERISDNFFGSGHFTERVTFYSRFFLENAHVVYIEVLFASGLLLGFALLFAMYGVPLFLIFRNKIHVSTFSIFVFFMVRGLTENYSILGVNNFISEIIFIYTVAILSSKLSEKEI